MRQVAAPPWNWKEQNELFHSFNLLVYPLKYSSQTDIGELPNGYENFKWGAHITLTFGMWQDLLERQ